MKSYIYVVTPSSPKRGFNRSITVYEIVDNIPHYVGDNDRIQTASFKGDYAVASKIVSDVQGLKMDVCGYRLEDRSIIFTGV